MQSPQIHYTGPDSKIPFTLILHSTNTAALDILSDPSAIKVTFVRSEVFGPDALAPRTTARKNRITKELAVGSIWRTREDDASLDEEINATGEEALSSSASSSSSATSDTLTGAGDDQERAVLEEEVLPKLAELLSNAGIDSAPDLSSADEPSDHPDEVLPEIKSKSPTPSLEDLDSTLFPGEDSIITLNGEIPIGSAVGWPSFRYKYLRCV